MHPLLRRIQHTFSVGVTGVSEWRGDVSVTVTRDKLREVAQFLREDPGMDFDYIVHVSSVDWPDDEERFEVVWEFYSIRKRQRIRLKTRVPEEDCVVDSLTDFWKGADFMEREVYDMMGIRFRNHPDLRRILMPDDYTEGYPLRKDFPLRGKGWRDTFDFLDEVPR
ncbi:MAG: NADH-quinone oxidoreductase subunit C [Nitrospira sp. HN-bin3]|jgi:NADH-quinone oxidoreductase subunit C|uniref:NADH-quinone oxidoreductase subunit C n=1 Tax=Nitrospira cf. moscoviensis SBR1015 TaxID=96242 RepID=UPI000A0E6488|nr:NADH-quinone oxidoreductase subunit C [Nitrospira cf. moscoviensis SBR1015]OQW44248.1 MAG: NADH-quinone oxidoreductase subunit C [Nitrospira sp. HN-bin3]